jgi:Holliday junction resolvase RusA-like endonuclease
MQTCKGCGGAGCKACIDQKAPTLFIPIEPMGAVRTTQKAKHVSESYKRYAAYKQELGYMVGSRLQFIPAGKAITITDLTFYMPMNDDKKTRIMLDGKRKTFKTIEGTPHLNKPDIDNLVKGLFDSLNKIAWADDNQVYQVTNVKKVYSDYPGIEFGIEYNDL